MSTTQYLNLNKPTGSDLVNPLTDTFPNWDIVDNAYHGLDLRALGHATELVSQGVHAITIVDTDCKTIKWTATANFTAGETFTVNGIQCNAYLPSGEALGTNAYVSGAQVIASLNDDNSAMTVYVPQGSVAVASDSERLGGELPSYYATKQYADGIKSTADSASQLIQKKALVNVYYDSSAKKLYRVNSDGTVGGEIVMTKELDFANKTEITTSTVTTNHAGAIVGTLHSTSNNQQLLINNAVTSTEGSGGTFGQLYIDGVPSGTDIRVSSNSSGSTHVYFVPYK